MLRRIAKNKTNNKFTRTYLRKCVNETTPVKCLTLLHARLYLISDPVVLNKQRSSIGPILHHTRTTQCVRAHEIGAVLEFYAGLSDNRLPTSGGNLSVSFFKVQPSNLKHITDRLPRNVGTELPLYAAQNPRTAQIARVRTRVVRINYIQRYGCWKFHGKPDRSQESFRSSQTTDPLMYITDPGGHFKICFTGCARPVTFPSKIRNQKSGYIWFFFIISRYFLCNTWNDVGDPLSQICNQNCTRLQVTCRVYSGNTQKKRTNGTYHEMCFWPISDVTTSICSCSPLERTKKRNAYRLRALLNSLILPDCTSRPI